MSIETKDLTILFIHMCTLQRHTTQAHSKGRASRESIDFYLLIFQLNEQAELTKEANSLLHRLNASVSHFWRV